ncbi:MAG: type II secretion system F family protein [Candidatus Pacearchaeota archaeon]|nr:type II secretion system F family protein [Candidatus Pacearchaeota archaeon]
MQELNEIKANLERMRNILEELKFIALAYETAKEEEKAVLEQTSRSLTKQLTLINTSITTFLPNLKFEIVTKAEKRESQPIKIERISTATGPVYIEEENKKKFMKELNLSEKAIKDMKTRFKKKVEEREEYITIVKPSSFAVFANKIFGEFSAELSKKALFKSAGNDLKKANMPYVLTTYISIIVFVTFIALILSFIVALALALAFEGNIFAVIRNLVIALAVTAIVFFLALSYPASIASSIRKKIETELPFAVSHMAAIASSKVEPSKIFSIIALNKEYKAVGVEIRKIVNQINIYGYDLTTSLRNVAKITSSKKLSDLLNGMATTITTGGDLTTYLNEKAKNLLLDYKLSRERYTTVIGMYSDIYTALLIAAPLIFMLILAIISVLGTTFLTMDISVLANLGIIVIAVLNIAFLVFLKMTQPEV